VSSRQEAGLHHAAARPDGSVEVDAAGHPVLGGVERQSDHAHPAPGAIVRTAAEQAPPAMPAFFLGPAFEGTAGEYGNFREQGGQCSHGGGFRRPFLAPHQDSSDARIDGIEEQSQFHILLTQNGRKRKNRRQTDSFHRLILIRISLSLRSQIIPVGECWNIASTEKERQLEGLAYRALL